jgi:hypothetical protein
MAAKKKPEGILEDIIKAAIKTAGKSAKKANPRNSYMFGKNMLHGSPTSGLRTISPRVSKKDDYGVNVVWGMNPRGRGSALNAVTASRYGGDKGSVYVVRVPRSAVKKVDPVTKKIVKSKPKDALIVSKKPAKVKKEIKVAGKPEQKIIKEINKGLVKSGSKKLDKSSKTKNPKIKKSQQPDF